LSNKDKSLLLIATLFLMHRTNWKIKRQYHKFISYFSIF